MTPGTRLDRDVAIKILPAAFAADADRLARFEREAKTLASLNHPNIAAIYGIEDNALAIAESQDAHNHGVGETQGQAEAWAGCTATSSPSFTP